MSVRVAGTGLAVLAVAGSAAIGIGGGPAGATPARQSEALPAAIHEGSCRRPAADDAFALADLAKPAGEIVRGLPFLSETRVDAALPALQSDPYALIVSIGEATPRTAVACGDLNTVTTADGATMVVGLFEQNSSLYTGVAALSAEGEQTLVRVYVARALNGGIGIGGGFGGDEPDEEPTQTVTVTVTDDALEVDTTELSAGTTVEFRVTNAGDDRHEVILEERGAEEEPLEIDDDTQAETEDLAPEEEVSFIYTFEDPGAYQLADHIADNAANGLVADLLVVEAEG